MSGFRGERILDKWWVFRNSGYLLIFLGGAFLGWLEFLEIVQELLEDFFADFLAFKKFQARSAYFFDTAINSFRCFIKSEISPNLLRAFSTLSRFLMNS